MSFLAEIELSKLSESTSFKYNNYVHCLLGPVNSIIHNVTYLFTLKFIPYNFH